MTLDILVSVLLVSLVSLVGAGTLSLRKEALQVLLPVLFAIGAGTLLGGAMFDLIPEAIEAAEEAAFHYAVAGIVVFFALDRFIHWHHHHHGEGEHAHRGGVKPFAYLNLIGEGLHNFLDGTIIAASYLVGFDLGVAATIAIIFHEIPQELGDFGILVHGGMPVRKALLANFLVALTAVAGAALVLAASSSLPWLSTALLGIAGGGFLYIAIGTLLPEIHHETAPRRIIAQIALLLIGILLMYGIGLAFPE